MRRVVLYLVGVIPLTALSDGTIILHKKNGQQVITTATERQQNKRESALCTRGRVRVIKSSRVRCLPVWPHIKLVATTRPQALIPKHHGAHRIAAVRLRAGRHGWLLHR